MKRRRDKCPSPAALDRAFSEGRSAELNSHLTNCPNCASEWRTMEQLSATAKSLPAVTLPDDQKDAIRTSVLFEARKLTNEPPIRSRRRATWAIALGFGFVGAAAAIALVFGTMKRSGHDATARQKDGRPVYRASVHEQAGARFARIGGQPDEIVRLFAGAITVDVEPLQAGERFRVVTGDAEIEVRGTMFDVHADGDRLDSIRVIRGRVEVRPAGAPATFVAMGEQWKRPTLAGTGARPAPSVGDGALSASKAPVTNEGAPAATKTDPRNVRGQRAVAQSTHVESVPVLPRGDSAPNVPSSAELKFQEGWTALRAGQFQRAAEVFAGVGVGASVSEDAAYWRAVALARAGRQEEAIAAYQGFLGLCPRSTRSGEASVALGWLLYARGEVAAASRRFGSAANDPDRRIRASALRGLELTKTP